MFPRFFLAAGSTKKSANNINARHRIPRLAEAIHHLASVELRVAIGAPRWMSSMEGAHVLSSATGETLIELK